METLRTPAYIRLLDEEQRMAHFALYANMFLSTLPFLSDRVSELEPDLADWVSRTADLAVSKADPLEFRQFWMALMLSRSVDNFHTYISEALLSVFRARPETLRSGSKVEVREVLECASIEEFAGRLAERRVEELSHQGFPSIQRYLEERLGIELKFDQEQLRLASEATAIRNLVVHNRGYVNERFLRDTGREDLRVGEQLEFDRQLLDRYTRALHSAAETIDVGLVRKFGIQLFLETEQT